MSPLLEELCVSRGTWPLIKMDPFVLKKPDPGDAHLCVDFFLLLVKFLLLGVCGPCGREARECGQVVVNRDIDHDLSTRPVGLGPVRRTRPQVHRPVKGRHGSRMHVGSPMMADGGGVQERVSWMGQHEKTYRCNP